MSQFHFTFSYQHQGSQTKELTILYFTGQEGISELFNFDLELKSDDIELDADGVVNQSCKIEVYYGDNATPLRVIHGFINEFEDVNYFPDSTLYRAKVVPRVWQLGHFETNEVYLKETIEQTLTVILEDASFVKDQDFRFELSRTYRAWPFRLQYNETHLDYLQRIIEREGIYYYFEHTNDSDVMVFCDNNQALPKIEKSAQADNVVFQANSGVYVDSHANTINSIICKRHTLPKKVTLRDFNDETPSLDIRGEFVINSTGVGDINLYGLNIVSPEEGQALAEIHANAYLSHQKTYIGQGDVANMIVGHIFSLQDHPRDSFNQLNYLLESIEHEGANLNQYQALHSDVAAPVNYTNSFSALSTEHEYAPKRQTVAPEINGTLNAVIDSEADSGYAELDDTGRYKVKLPFDRKDRNGGKASHWVRMMQPYGGANEGMHFPLHNNTRVLLGFIGGDPDRPFISGTINDSGEQQSIVTAENQSNNLIKTASGNKIELEDKEGKNRIKLQTGDNKTYMHLGAPNHDGSGFVMVTEGIERRDIRGGQRVTIQTGNTAVGSLSPTTFVPTLNYSTGDIVTYQGKLYQARVANIPSENPSDSIWADNDNDKENTWEVYISNKSSLFAFPSPSTGTDTLFDIDTDLTKDQEVSGDYIIHRISGTQYSWNEGEAYNFLASAEDGEGVHSANSNNKQYSFGNQWEVNCIRYTYPSTDELLKGKGPNALIDEMMKYSVSNINYYNSDNPITLILEEQAQVDQDVLEAKAAVDTWAITDKKQSTINAFEIIEGKEIYTSKEAAEEAFKQLIIDYWVDPFIVDEKAKNQTILDGRHVKIQPEKFSLKSTMLEKAASIAKKLREDNIHAYLFKNYFLRSGWRDNLSDLTTAAELLIDLKIKTKDRIDYTVPRMKIWTKYLSEARVKVAHHDTVTMQKGNIYDFGGYWNYNLGNSYEENTISQNGTKVNRDDLPYDWCDIGGPAWTALSPKKDKKAESLAATFDKTSAPTYLAGFKDNTNVEKTIDGHAYNYSTNTHSIDVSHKCNSINVSVAGESHEVKYSGVTHKKIYESKSGGGVSEEWKSTFGGDRTEYEKVDVSGKHSPGKVTETRVSTYGNPVSYEIVREPAPGSKFSFKGDVFPTLEMKMEIDVGSTVLSTHIGVMDNSVNMDATAMINSVSIDAAIMKSSISISGCPLETEIEIGPAGLKKFETDLPGFKLTAAMVALKMKQEAAVDMANHKVVIKNKLAEIDKGTVSLGARACDLRNNLITLLN
jgi:type VI secretion system VgrG family protein